MTLNENGRGSIINYYSDSFDIAAAAGRISTTFGSAENIYEKSKGNSHNLDLISKVLKSGHMSIIEHIYFNLAFNNVSVFVEQFIIEFRLASFTVQSRRYVDFSNVGYYLPDNLSKNILKMYNDNMNYLFDCYGRLLELDIPKEDARFVLPYCFKSNFFCTCNARELMHIICSMIYGKGSDYPEILSLGKSLKEQFEKVLPNVFEKECGKYIYEKKRFGNVYISKIPKPTFVESNVELISNNVLDTIDLINQSNEEADITSYLELLLSPRSRELELISLVYRIANISMAGLTHLTRHRIQTLIIPDILSTLEKNNFILPDSIKNNNTAKSLYLTAIEKNNECVNELIHLGISKELLVYFVLSGNTIDVISSMNAREFFKFSCLRTCNRAQWEIRRIAIEMIAFARKCNNPLFMHFGPSCYSTGICPEGRMTCGKSGEVKRFFSAEDLKYLETIK